MSADTPYERLRHFLPEGDEVGLDGYEVLHPIGEGGFGRVYRARQLAFDRDVAIKVLGATGFKDETARRFERECRAVGALSSHPHIVTIYDSGITPWGRPFIVMEHMAGGSLASRLAAEGPLATDVALPAIVKICGAVAAAHRNGILHRDIKPENLLISGYGEPVLADFGVASIPGGYQTHTGAITASLAHAAPEVLDGQKATPATDIYSLGSTLFTLLSGHAAFESPDQPGLQALIARTMTQPVPDLRATGVPGDVCAVIERAMAKDPGDRFERVEELAAALQEAEAALGFVPTELLVPDDLRVAPEDLPATEQARTVLRQRSVLAPSIPPPPRRAPRWRSPLAAATVVLVMVAGAGTTMVLKTRRSAERVATAPTGVAPQESPSADATPVGVERDERREKRTREDRRDRRRAKDGGTLAFAGGSIGSTGGTGGAGGTTPTAGVYTGDGGGAQTSTSDGGGAGTKTSSGTGTKTEPPPPEPADTLLHHLYSDDGSYYFTASASEFNQKRFDYDYAHREAAVWAVGTQKMRRVCFGDGRCGGWVYIEKPAGLETRALYAFTGPDGDFYTTNKAEIPSQYSDYRVSLFGWAQ